MTDAQPEQVPQEEGANANASGNPADPAEGAP